MSNEQTFFSGQPGTTGREPFEDSTATGPGDQFVQGGNQHHGHHHHHHHHQEGAIGGGLGAAGTTGFEGGQRGQDQYGAVGAGQTGFENRQTGQDQFGTPQGNYAGGQGNQDAFDTGRTGATQAGVPGAGIGGYGPAKTGGEHADRVGNLNQGAALSDRTTNQGPQTTGAAGTDRFDSDKVWGAGAAGEERGAGWEGGESKAQLKSGGLQGVFATSDKDFVNRERLGEGAYHDDNARFKGNLDGPHGHSALTGREGTYERNPVAQAKSRSGEAVHPNDPNFGSGERAGEQGVEEGEVQNKSIFQKVKDAII
ncbi:hypothetical protein M231_05895 [Tremella mesenterica]|uniref:Uncharacterized protein n=1 Tax=Tremella mesenterica TaxID=5217 RepID=A0A4Q1BGV6_TREME|nr:hypothetical protein M231_05895 [Tremella mesenterica]